MKKMLKNTAITLAAVMTAAALPIGAQASASAIYVSPTGDDSAAGTLSAPLKTLAAAKEKVKEVNEAGVTVYFTEGTYPMTEAVEFWSDDSGSADKPIAYKALDGARVVFSGGITLDNSKFTDSDNDGIYEYDLSAVEDLGILPYSGGESGSYSVELFSNEEPMTIAKYPNTGYITIAESDIVSMDGNYTLKAPEGKAQAWAQEADARAFGHWSNNYSATKYKLTVDGESGTFSTNTRASGEAYNVKAGQNYYVYNMFCELDEAGEYYIDRNAKKLYYKPTDLNSETLVLSVMADSFIKNTSAKYITFDGLTFEYGRKGGYERNDNQTTETNKNASYTSIKNCTFKNLAGTAVYYSGENSEISGNTIKNVDAGIKVSAGNMNTLASANVKINNNTISGFSRIKGNYAAAVNVMGCGNTVSGNEIFDGPHNAIEFSGNDHIISNNDIHDVLLACSDMGAIYSHIGNNPKNYGFRGTRIINNYIHNLGMKANEAYQPYNFTGAGSHRYAVYLDGACGDVIKNNIFLKTEYGVCVNSGRDNDVVNNLFAEVTSPVLMTSLSAGQTSELTGTELKKFLYSGGWGIGDAHKKYRGLYDDSGELILNGTNFGIPSGNVIEKNLSYLAEDGREWKFQSVSSFSEDDAKEINTISAPFISETLTESDFENYGTSKMKLTKTVSGFQNDEIGIEDDEPIDLGKPKIGLFTIGDFRGNEVKEYAIDGDPNTTWTGTWEGKGGSWIEMDLNGQYLVSGINYLCRAGNKSGSDSYGSFYLANVEVSNDRVHYRRVNNGIINAFKWNQTDATNLVIPFVDGAEYVRYIRIRSIGSNYYGEGAAEISPILEDASAKSRPEVKNGTVGTKILGTLAAGGTVYGEYFYYNSGATAQGATKYTYYTATTQDGKDLKAVASGYTNGEFPSYTLTERDAGKYLQLALIPTDKNGKEGARTVSYFYKIADSAKSEQIMAAIDEIKTAVPQETQASVTLPQSVANGTVTYSNKNGAYLNENGTLKALSNSVTDVLPTLENGDSIESFNAHITLSDGTEADYFFPITVKAKASQVYADWDYGIAAEDATLTDEEQAAATHSGEHGAKVAKVTGAWGNGQNKPTGVGNKWAGYTRYSLGNWNNNANPATLITELDQKKALSLWIGRVYVKPVSYTSYGVTINEFKPTNIEIATSNSFGNTVWEYIDSISYSSAPTLKVDEWTEVQVVASVQGDKNQAGNINLALSGTAWNSIPNEIYVDDFKAEPLKVGSIAVSGDTSIEIPSSGTKTSAYTADVLNQFGTTLGFTDTHMTKKPEVIYSIKNPRAGISINEKTGELTVASGAETGEIIIEAMTAKSDAANKTTVSADYTAANADITGWINPWGAGVVKSEYTVNIINPYGIESQVTTENPVAGNALELGMVTTEGADNISDSYTWYADGKAVTIATEISVDPSNMAKIYNCTIPKELGGKTLKLGVETNSGTVYSKSVYIKPYVDADQLFIYNAGVQKTTMTLTAGEKLTALRNIKNNTEAAIKAVMIIGRYAKDGKLLEVNMSVPVEIAAGATETVSVELNVPEALTNGEYAEAFVMSEALSPYANKITIK